MPHSSAPQPPRRPAAQTREHVLRVTRDLFYWRGIHAVGIDTIARQADVATTTLYRLFGSKDGLVAAYIDREATNHRQWFEDAIGAPNRPARARIIDLFTALTELLDPEICRGCPFQMALAETPHATDPARQSAVDHKRWVHERFHALAAEHLNTTRASKQGRYLADLLTLMYEGAFATAQSLGADGPPRSLPAIARQILP